MNVKHKSRRLGSMIVAIVALAAAAQPAAAGQNHATSAYGQPDGWMHGVVGHSTPALVTDNSRSQNDPTSAYGQPDAWRSGAVSRSAPTFVTDNSHGQNRPASGYGQPDGWRGGVVSRSAPTFAAAAGPSVTVGSFDWRAAGIGLGAGAAAVLLAAAAALGLRGTRTRLGF
jgi:hypothetical protein